MSLHQVNLLSGDQFREIKKDSELHFHKVIVEKLEPLFNDSVSVPKWFLNFSKCGKPSGAILKCFCCGEVRALNHRCSLKFCPVCVWRITQARREKLTVWAKSIQNPVHLVLTQKNFPTLSRSKIREHYDNLKNIRRNDCFDPVRGGSTSVEITNKGEGWHLHSHWLLDSDWLDMSAVSQAWAKRVNQEFAIAKVKAVTEDSYVAECLKYVTKGSEVAEWPAEQILEYILAIRNSRFFFVFGSLFKQRAMVKKLLNEMQPKVDIQCQGCQSIEVHYLPESGMAWEREQKFVDAKFIRLKK